MEKNDFYVTVHYEDKEYRFLYGSEAYIFHTGLYNDIHKRHGIKGLLQYTKIVQECYIKDDNRTPLGALADYVAEHWRTAKKTSPRNILSAFYDYSGLEVA